MPLSLINKISRRIHPVPYLLYNWRAKRKGVRSFDTALKYGQPIDAHGDHVHCYLTLGCNLNCYFCINKQYVHKLPIFQIEAKETWLRYLNRLYNCSEMYFQGGEPFLHPNIAGILNGLDGFNVCVFTNLPRRCYNRIIQLRKGTNNIILKISYHPLNDDPVNLFVERLRWIPKGILWQIHLVEVPEVSFDLFARAFRRYNVVLRRECYAYEPYLKDTRDTKTVLCKSNMEVIAPDMTVYPCLAMMLMEENSLGQAETHLFEKKFRRCAYYGKCGQCSTAKEIQFLP